MPRYLSKHSGWRKLSGATPAPDLPVEEDLPRAGTPQKDVGEAEEKVEELAEGETGSTA
jgi:hypothetical protein